MSEKYGWKIVDYPKLVKERLTTILAEEAHLPNNVDPEESSIGLSQKEIDDIKTGNPFASWKFIPWMLDFLGYALKKRDPVEPEEGAEEIFEGMPVSELTEELKPKYEAF